MISKLILKECGGQLCTLLLLMFRNSVKQGILPKAWKVENISPLYKSSVIRRKHCTWRRVSSEVPQRSVYAPITFIIVLSAFEANISLGSCLNMFADDTKL